LIPKNTFSKRFPLNSFNTKIITLNRTFIFPDKIISFLTLIAGNKLRMFPSKSLSKKQIRSQPLLKRTKKPCSTSWNEKLKSLTMTPSLTLPQRRKWSKKFKKTIKILSSKTLSMFNWSTSAK
jgi:hypothetical protein